MRTLTFLIASAIALAPVLGCTKKKALRGTVELPSNLAQKVEPTAVLYIIARPAGHEGGPPMAVKRIESPLRFPLDFELRETDAMIPDTEFDGQVVVSARIAQAGSALPIQPGDIEGSARGNPIEVGSSEKIRIELDRVVE